MKRGAVIGLSVGFGIFGALVLMTVILILTHYFQVYSSSLIGVGESYEIDGVSHVLDPLPLSGPGSMMYPCMKDSVARHLKGLYTDLKAVLDSEGIAFWASGGTLIGWARHRGFIPWDDDIDVHMQRSDLARLLSPECRAALRRRDLELYWMPLYRHDIIKVGRRGRSGVWSRLCVDILFQCELGGQWGTCASSVHDPACRRLVESETFDKSDIFPLREEIFEDVRMWVPRNPGGVLKAQYGDNIMKKYLVDVLHWSAIFTPHDVMPG